MQVISDQLHRFHLHNYQNTKLIIIISAICLWFHASLPTVKCSDIVWQSHPKFVVDHLIVFQNSFETNYSAPWSFSRSFQNQITQSVKYAIGLTRFQAHPFSSFGYEFGQANIQNYTLHFSVKICEQGVLTSMSVSYIVIAKSSYDFCFGIDEKQLEAGSPLSTAQSGGLRSGNVSFDFGRKIFNAEHHQIQFTIYIQHLQMSNPNGSYFYLDWKKHLNRTHYTIELITDGQNTISKLKFSILIVDKSLFKEFRFFSISQIWQFTCPSNDECISNHTPEAKYVGPDRQFYGISGFNLTKQKDITMFINASEYQSSSDYGANIQAFQQSQSVNFFKISSFKVAAASKCEVQNQYINDLACVASCDGESLIQVTEQSGRKYCDVCNYTCKTCDNSNNTVCMSCTDTREMQNNACKCIEEYFDVINVQQCLLCSKYIPGCKNCQDYDSCTECSSVTGFQSQPSDDGICQCANFSHSINQNGVCVGLIGCLVTQESGSDMKCIQCDLLANFMLLSYQCECRKGTYLQTPTTPGTSAFCQHRCGDAIYSDNEECDDGNTLDGDGCDATCEVQTDYVCLGYLGETSYCVLNKSINLRFMGAIRQGHLNSATLYFQLTPFYINPQSQSNFNNFVSFDAGSIDFGQSSFNCSFVKLKGMITYLTVSFDYFSDIDPEELHKLTVNLKDAQMFSQNTNTESFRISGLNFDLNFHQDQSLIEYLQQAILSLVVACLIVSGASAYSERMIGVEIMQRNQMLFFYLFLLNNIGHDLITAQQNLSYTNGYGQGELGFTQLSYLGESPKLLRMRYSKAFFGNFNYTSIVFLIPVVLILGRILYPALKQSNKPKGFKRMYSRRLSFFDSLYLNPIEFPFFLKWQFITGDVLVLATLAFSNQILFSFLISSNQYSAIELTENSVFTKMSIIFPFICMIVYALVFLLVAQQLRTDIDNESRLNYMVLDNYSSVYVMIFIVTSYTKIIFFFIMLDSEYCVYYMLTFQLAFLIILAIWKPYKPQFHVQGQSNYQEQVSNSAIKPQKPFFQIHNAHNIISSLGTCTYIGLIILCNLESMDRELMEKILSFLAIALLLINLVMGLLRMFIIYKGAALGKKGGFLARNSDENEYLKKEHANRSKVQNQPQKQIKISTVQRQKLKQKSKSSSIQMSKINLKKG